MSDYGTNKKTLSKEVNYLGRDFTDIRENLIEFAKSYFPNQYNDFNEASPGMTQGYIAHGALKAVSRCIRFATINCYQYLSWHILAGI